MAHAHPLRPNDILPRLQQLSMHAEEKNTQQYGFGTRLIHVGSEPDPVTGAVIPPISLSTTFKQSAPGVHSGYEYSRSANPNRTALETLLGSAEGGGGPALAFASGSAATATLLTALGPGAGVLSVNDVYGGTFRFMERVAREVADLRPVFVDLETATDEQVLAAITPETKLIWVESPTNPTLRLIDISRLARLARAHPAQPLVLVDNTFLSPFYASPLQTGADIVLHSATKYINGHSDVVLGALVFPAYSSEEGSASEEDHARKDRVRALYSRTRFLQNAIGAVPSPHDAWLAQRGAKTLHLRMRAHGSNALLIARALRSHPAVLSVSYPGLAPTALSSALEAQRFALARRVVLSSEAAARWLETEGGADAWAQVHGGLPFGGVLSFSLRGGAPAANAFLGATKLFALAESLGGVESLAEAPAIMTHAAIPPHRRAELGIDDGLVRLSVGIEEGEDLLRDVLQAVEKAVAVGSEESSAESSKVGSGEGSPALAEATAATSVESLELK